MIAPNVAGLAPASDFALVVSIGRCQQGALAERAAIELAHFGGRTHCEIAAELGEPDATIKSRIRNGLKQLRTGMVRSDAMAGADG